MFFKSIKARLLGFIAISIICVLAINLYSVIRIRSLEEQYNEMINKMFIINRINKEITSSKLYFEKYFLTKTDSDLKNYVKHYENAMDDVSRLSGYGALEEDYLIDDLSNTMESYLESSKETILASYRDNKGEEFYSRLQETKEITTFINDYCLRLQDEYLRYNEELYNAIAISNNRKNLVLFFSSGMMLIFASAFALLMSRDITRPLNDLAQLSYRISKGEFDAKELKKPEIYELQVVTEGFNTMIKNINSLIIEMKDKSAIEQRLRDEELKNLLTQNMLKESRLKMLQSQINPHFLFNTLNSIVLTSVEEGAYNTERMLNSVSVLLRYSLNMIDHITTLREEFEIIKEYLYLQSIRFGERIRFNINIDDEVLGLKIPGMILQPLVENALVHGIENKEEGGIIDIEAKSLGRHCIIKIEDNGIGMNEVKIKEILEANRISKIGELSTGLGVGNVINRLKIFFGDEDIVTILSQEEVGTKVYLRIPLEEVQCYV